MKSTVTIVDEVFGSGNPNERRIERAPLRLRTHEVTVADLIRFRVEAELDRREDTLAAMSRKAERGPQRAQGHEVLNDRSAQGRGFQQFSPDWDVGAEQRHEAVQAAQEAFARGDFLLLIDRRQVCDLNERVALCEVSEAVFLRLIPLVGG